MLPIACLPMAHWYVLRGDWLWCGKGMSPAQTPSSVNGSISRCVVSGTQRDSYSATRLLFSSFTSRYSISPARRKDVKSISRALRAAMCESFTLGTPASQMMSGRQTRPPSLAMCSEFWITYTLTNSPRCPVRRRSLSCLANRSGRRWMPISVPFRNTMALLRSWSSAPLTSVDASTPSAKASCAIGPSSSSVVMCVISARFLTSPQASPSGVSAGHSMPHWLGCRARGPLTLRVFSNCEVILVIMPSALMNDRRDNTCVTPLRSMRNRLMVQFPELMACSRP
mmetsp:Transcript_33124/g.78562  ORF Transcript_33124/g.78562 Transcript_33124/m.78562 type:complete len:283 (+) Transcript_33124:1479-2327(+)